MRSAEAVATMRPVFQDLMGTFAEHRLALGRFHDSAETLFIKQHSPVLEIIPPVHADVRVGLLKRRTEPRVVQLQQVVERPRDPYIDVLAGDIPGQLAAPATREHTEAALDALAVMNADFASLEKAEANTVAKVHDASESILHSIDQVDLSQTEKEPIIATLDSTMKKATRLLTSSEIFDDRASSTVTPATIQRVTQSIVGAVGRALAGDPKAHPNSGPFTERADTYWTNYRYLPDSYREVIHPEIEKQLGTFDEIATYFDELALQMANAGARTDYAQAAARTLASRTELRSASNSDARAMLTTAIDELNAFDDAAPFRTSVEKAAEIAAKSAALLEVDALSKPPLVAPNYTDDATQLRAARSATSAVTKAQY
jgi:hypothetical protein